MRHVGNHRAAAEGSGKIRNHKFAVNLHGCVIFFSIAHQPGFFFVLFCFLGPHPRHMEVPRIGVELELQLLAYTTAQGNAGSLTH